LTNLSRRELSVENVNKDLEGRTATVVGWGYTTGYDPWLGKLQQDVEDYGVPSRKQQKLTVPILTTEDCEWRRPSTTQVSCTALHCTVNANVVVGSSDYCSALYCTALLWSRCAPAGRWAGTPAAVTRAAGSTSRSVPASSSHLLRLQKGRKEGKDSAPWYLLGIVSYGTKYCGDGR
jgi:hypothetical protein